LNKKTGCQKTAGSCIYRGKSPAVKDDLLPESIPWAASKNTRRVFSRPEKIFGVRNFNMIISSPHPIALSIFIQVMLEEGLNTVVTSNYTLANNQITPLFLCNQDHQIKWLEKKKRGSLSKIYTCIITLFV